MNDEQRRKLAESLGGVGTGRWGLARDIGHDPQAHIDLLVEVGLLRRGVILKVNDEPLRFAEHPCGQYYEVVPQRKPVRAGYRKLAERTWTFTCSEGCIPGAQWGSPDQVRRICWHFENAHPDLTVEWDDPPRNVHITYERHGDGALYSCSACSHISLVWPRDTIEGVAHRHGSLERHANDHVTFGELPKPHEHSFTWQVTPTSLWQPYCPCGTWMNESIKGFPYQPKVSA